MILNEQISAKKKRKGLPLPQEQDITEKKMKSNSFQKETKQKFEKKTSSNNKRKREKKNNNFNLNQLKDQSKDGKPLWNKIKTEKKKLRETRKVHRTGEEQYQLSVKAKAIWEKLRRKNHSEDKKEALVNELFMLLKGQIPNVVQCHDMARVVQWMLKLGSPSVRSSICEALCANTVAYLQSKYASYCVKRALKYGSKNDRNSLIQSCSGHFFKLFSHLYASRVVELMYAVFASAEQRRQIHREMYGEMHALVAADVTSIQHIPDNMRPSILAATKANLTKLLSKKELYKYTLLQSLLHDFLASCSAQDRTDILELIQGDVLEFLTTKEGAKVALQVVWHGTNKIKKVIVKALKGKVKETACSEVGHILLLALFDCVDDTVLVKKALIPEVLTEAVEMAKNEWGRKVILYLVAHRDPAYFHPQQMKILEKGDAIAVRKKDSRVREQEMLEAVSAPLLTQVASDPATWLGDSSMAMVALAVIKSGNGEALRKAYEALADHILDPNSMVEVSERKFHVIEDSALHLVLKKLIQQHPRLTEEDKSRETFPKVLASRLTEKDLNFVMQFNRGCFILVLMIELKCEEINKVLKKKITEPMKKFLQKQETTGAKVLLKKLVEL